MAPAASVVLLFSSALRTGADYESALRGRGYEVLRAASTRSLERYMRDEAVELVLLDCGSSDTARAIGVLEASGRSVPRLWVSSSPDAPARSSHLGVDALLIDPDDVVAVLDSIERFLAPHGQVTPPHPFLAGGTNPPPRPPRDGQGGASETGARPPRDGQGGASETGARPPRDGQGGASETGARPRPRGTGPVADGSDPSVAWDEPTSDYKLKPPK